ncbi:MAG TPA: hypothetical protein VL486_07365 [Verrucomicrobiae bacterium]|nr:hypothetical protein [Verrucomicrobiae bacterium]
MKGQKGIMNIDFSEHYDQEDDIYYVTFKTGEPSIVEEIDDVLLMEIGIFTGMPTGFRILNFNKHNIAQVGFRVLVKKAERVFESARTRFGSASRIRKSQLEQAFDQVLT